MAPTPTPSLALSNSAITSRGILFNFNPHPDEDHHELNAILNGKYRCQLKMTVAEMQEDERVYTSEGNGEEHVNLKCIENIKEFFVQR